MKGRTQLEEKKIFRLKLIQKYDFIHHNLLDIFWKASKGYNGRFLHFEEHLSQPSFS